MMTRSSKASRRSRGKKSVRKSARKSAIVLGRPFQQGNDARRGRGPEKGHGGRPPEDFIGWLQGKFADPKERTKLWKRGQRSDRIMVRLLEYAYNKPPQPITGDEHRPIIVKRIDIGPDGTRIERIISQTDTFQAVH